MVKMSKNAKPVIKVRNLSVAFGKNEAVHNISFDINQGEMLSLVGESGSGKSVTALSLLRLLPYPAASHPSGEIIFAGKDILKMKEKELSGIRGEKIAMIFQEPMTSLNPLHTIKKQIAEALTIKKNIPHGKVKERVNELLRMVELDALITRPETYPHELSGGQRQRVMIAMALASEPELLIADEPTTALDVTVQARILKLLKKLQKELNMAILLITHDLTIVRKLSERICVMHNGNLIECGQTAEIFENPQHAYTKHLLSSEPKGTAKPIKDNSEVIVNTSNLKVSFPIKYNFFGKPIAFIDAVKSSSIELKSGETLGIVGESGSGKTTLAMAVLRLIKSEGVINFQNRRIDSLNGNSLRPLRKEMQVVFQDPFASLNPRMMVADIIAEGLKAHNIGKNNAERDEIIIKSLNDVGLNADMRHRYPHEFSGGQRQRIAIARALALDPKLVILDEPTSALDLSVQAQIINLLRNLQEERGLSYIFISHDLRVIKAISHRIIVMKDGNIMESGTMEQIFGNPSSPYTKELLKASNISA